MKSIKHYKVTITDVYNAVFELPFTRYQYPNLRTLIAHSYPEEFGECKGRGLCGTCHIKTSEGILTDTIESAEKEILTSICNTDTNSRLACQILLDDKINNMTFKIITE